MTTDILAARRLIQDALAAASQTSVFLASAQAANAATIAALKQALQAGFEAADNTRFTLSAPTSEHRRLHRMGYPAKIDADPELQAFIRAHIDRLTFDQLATAVEQNFPPERHVRRSAIHAWWKRNRTRLRKPPVGPGYPADPRSLPASNPVKRLSQTL